MRAVNATLLAALQAGTGKPKIVAHVGFADGSTKYTTTPISYKLTGLSLELHLPYVADFAKDQVTVWLERGLTIAGVDYTITSGRFFIARQQYLQNKSQILTANLLPQTRYYADGHDTYKNVIDAFCTAFGKTAVYRNPAEAWLNYYFFPAGKFVLMNDANHFFNLLDQKRLIHACDNGGEQILFYSADVMGATDAVVAIKDLFSINTTKLRSRQYIWKDENGTVHTDGTASDPLHNLGYLTSTDSPPARHFPTFEAQAIIRPDLRFQDGDIIELDLYDTNTGTIFAHPIEIYDPGGSTRPAWRLQLEANPVFNNTEGGVLPSSIEPVTNYLPLNTGTFTGALSSLDNNLQAAMDTIDQHHHSIIAAHGGGATVGAGLLSSMIPFTAGLGAGGGSMPIPQTGTLKNMYFRLWSAQPATGTLVITLHAGASTTIVITIPAGSAAGLYSNLVDSGPIAKGEYLYWGIQNNAAAASGQIGGVTVELT